MLFFNFKLFFGRFFSQKKEDFILPYYPQLSVRMYRGDEYNKYLISNMSQKVNLNESGESELKSLLSSMDFILYELIQYGEFDTDSLSEKEILMIHEEIVKKDYSFSCIQGFEVKDTFFLPFLLEFPNQNILSGRRAIVQNHSLCLTKRDRLVLGGLSLFLAKKMLSLCIGNDYFHNENKKHFPCPLYFGDFLNSIMMTGPCCIGCYTNLSLLRPYVNREHLFDRLGEHILSPEILHLLRSFLDINIIYSMDGDILFDSKKGLLNVYGLTTYLFDFLFNEFAFYLRMCGYFCTIVEYALFIGVPSHFMENSSVYVIKESVYNNIKNSLAKIKIPVDALDKLLSCSFIKEGESISLLGGSQLRLHNNQFTYLSRDNHDL